MRKIDKETKESWKRTGEKIKQLREAEKLTQPQLADKLDLESQTISKWEIGAQGIGKDSLVKIAQFFNVSIDYLINDKDKDPFWKTFAIDKRTFITNLSTYANFDLADVYKEIQDVMKDVCPALLDKLQAEVVSKNIEMVPIVSPVACAGSGNGYAELEWNRSDYYPIEKTDIMGHIWRAAGFKIIKISGDSMEPRFFDTDKILFVEGEEIHSGDVVVVWWDNRLYIRGYLDEGHNIVLKPLNKKYSDIEISKEDQRLYILGKVIARIPPIEMINGFF